MDLDEQYADASDSPLISSGIPEMDKSWKYKKLTQTPGKPLTAFSLRLRSDIRGTTVGTAPDAPLPLTKKEIHPRKIWPTPTLRVLHSVDLIYDIIVDSTCFTHLL